MSWVVAKKTPTPELSVFQATHFRTWVVIGTAGHTQEAVEAIFISGHECAHTIRGPGPLPVRFGVGPSTLLPSKPPQVQDPTRDLADKGSRALRVSPGFGAPWPKREAADSPGTRPCHYCHLDSSPQTGPASPTPQCLALYFNTQGGKKPGRV